MRYAGFHSIRFTGLVVFCAVTLSLAGGRGSALDTGDLATLTRIRLQHQIDTVEIFRKANGQWWVADLGLPARSALVTQTLLQLQALREQDPVNLGSRTALESYGLQPEEAWFVRFSFAGGEVRRLRIGMPSGRQDTMFWARDAGDPLLEKTPPPRQAFMARGIPLTTDINGWPVRHLLPRISPKDVAVLEVTWVDSLDRQVHYKLERHGDSVMLMEPAPGPANPHRAMETLAQAASLAIDGFVEPDEPLPQAPAIPRASLLIELKDGRRFALASQGSSRRFDYVLHPEIPGVRVKLLKSRLEAFMHTPRYLTTSPPLGPEPDDPMNVPLPPGIGVYAPHGDSDSHEQGEDHQD